MSAGVRVPLASIAESVDYGVTASAIRSQVGPKFLRITDIQDDHVDWGAVPWCECDGRALESSRLRPGDIVFARTGATTGKSYLIDECPPCAVFASYLIRVRVNPGVDSRYVSHFFKSEDYWAQISKAVRGVAQPGVNATTLKSLEIPLPSPSEQRRIAAILDKADNLRTKRREALAELDRLAQSIFLEMFGDPVTNPSGWRSTHLGNVCDVGSSKRVFLEELVDEGVPFYRGTEIGQLGEGKAVQPSLFISDEHYQRLKSEAGVPNRGDLLLPSICPDGRIHTVGSDEPFYFKDARVLWIKVDQSKINSAFLRHYLKLRFAKDYSKIASGTTFAELKIFALKQLNVHLPGIELQHRFADVVRKVESQQLVAKSSNEELERLFRSIQVRAFTGKL